MRKLTLKDITQLGKLCPLNIKELIDLKGGSSDIVVVIDQDVA